MTHMRTVRLRGTALTNEMTAFILTVSCVENTIVVTTLKNLMSRHVSTEFTIMAAPFSL